MRLGILTGTERARLLLGAIVTIMLTIVLILLALPEVIGPKRR